MFFICIFSDIILVSFLFLLQKVVTYQIVIGQTQFMIMCSNRSYRIYFLNSKISKDLNETIIGAYEMALLVKKTYMIKKFCTKQTRLENTFQTLNL